MRDVRIDCSPWVRLALKPGDRDRIEAECLIAGVSGVTLLAKTPGGPYTARLSGGAVASDRVSPLDAVRAAIDEQRWKEAGYR